jgi:hypothetical protein
MPAGCAASREVLKKSTVGQSRASRNRFATSLSSNPVVLRWIAKAVCATGSGRTPTTAYAEGVVMRASGIAGHPGGAALEGIQTVGPRFETYQIPHNSLKLLARPTGIEPVFSP